MTEKTLTELRTKTDQLMHSPLHMHHEARIAALAAERSAADFEIERLTRERDEARAEVERMRHALEEATRALAVDPRFLSPARLETARSILSAALADEGRPSP